MRLFSLLMLSLVSSHFSSTMAGMGSSEGFFTSSVRAQHLCPDFFLRITYADTSQAEISWDFIRHYAAQYTFLPGFESLAQGNTPPDGISVYLCNGPSICKLSNFATFVNFRTSQYLGYSRGRAGVGSGGKFPKVHFWGIRGRKMIRSPRGKMACP